MALNPETKFPGRITASSPDYPYGSSKNETVPLAGDGTPYELARANDVFGLQQALLFQTGVVPSGNADTSILSQYLDSMKRLNSLTPLMDDSGGLNVYVLAPTGAIQVPAAYFDGMQLTFIASVTNTLASTVNVSGIGAKDIRKVGGGILSAGNIRIDRLNTIRFDLANDYFVLESQLVQSNKQLTGFQISNNAVDAINDFDVAPGFTTDDAGGLVDLALIAGLTKRLDANWVAGDAAGGFPSGLVLTDATWYHVFAIVNASGSVDCGVDTSLAATNLLADAVGYSSPRRLGSIYYVNGASGIRPFRQIGDLFSWRTPVGDWDAVFPIVSTLLPLSVPNGIEVAAITNLSVNDFGAGTGTEYMVVSHPDEILVASASVATFSWLNTSDSQSTTCRIVQITDTNSQIRWDGTSAQGGRADTVGWFDNRGV